MKSKLVYCLCSFFMACNLSNPSLKNDNQTLRFENIRKIPIEEKDSINGSKSIVIYYEVSLNRDSVNKHEKQILDQYVCKEYRLKNLEKYDKSVIVKFLKKSNLTEKFRNQGISDSNNPGSSEHFVFASYQWLYNKFYKKKYNEKEYFFELDCRN